jgi:hypothetical protein
VFLDIFPGSGRLGKAMASRGYHVLRWDLKWGPSYDLFRAKNRSLLRGWILSRLVVALHIGTPCYTWCRVGETLGGLPPLRSDCSVWGLPDLKPGELLSTTRANVLAKFTASILFVCRHMRVPAVATHPEASRLWLCPPIKRFLRCARVSVVSTDLCQWGGPWLRAFSIMGCFVDLDSLRRRCAGGG